MFSAFFWIVRQETGTGAQHIYALLGVFVCLAEFIELLCENGIIHQHGKDCHEEGRCGFRTNLVCRAAHTGLEITGGVIISHTYHFTETNIGAGKVFVQGYFCDSRMIVFLPSRFGVPDQEQTSME